MRLIDILIIVGGLGALVALTDKTKKAKKPRKARKKKSMNRFNMNYLGLNPQQQETLKYNLETCTLLDRGKKIHRLITIYKGIHGYSPSYTTFFHRLKTNWKLEEIVCTPIRGH